MARENLKILLVEKKVKSKNFLKNLGICFLKFDRKKKIFSKNANSLVKTNTF